MFLFESFTYNDRWASIYYEDFYEPKEYFKKYLNNDYTTENGEFFVNSVYDKTHEKVRLVVKYTNKADLFDDTFPKNAYKFALDKLKNYGPAVDIEIAEYPKLLFRYYREKDEIRWNYQHDEINTGMINGLVIDCKPTLEQWIYMLGARENRKNPTNLFLKEHNIKQAAAKYIIAIKLQWEDAIYELKKVISKLLSSDQYQDKIPSRFINWVEAYANFMYEPDSEINDLIDDFNNTSKNISPNKSIPSRLIPIIEKLDENPDVKQYYILPNFSYVIDIETINGNKGRMYIDEDENTGPGFYRIELHLKGNGVKRFKKSHSYKLKSLAIEVDSAVNAIYKDDLEELGKIIIKL